MKIVTLVVSVMIWNYVELKCVHQQQSVTKETANVQMDIHLGCSVHHHGLEMVLIVKSLVVN